MLARTGAERWLSPRGYTEPFRNLIGLVAKSLAGPC